MLASISLYLFSIDELILLQTEFGHKLFI
jgi:hypothetical protein